jgi:hypothetical protein
VVSGCERQARPGGESAETGPGEVVVYTALDRQFSEPILADFTRRTGIKVRSVYDSESTKTIGLVNRIRAERVRPRCDVFWNNEILNTLRLKSEGRLQPCQPAQAEHYPARYRDPEGYWHGFAARARVIIVNTELVKPQELLCWAKRTRKSYSVRSIRTTSRWSPATRLAPRWSAPDVWPSA